MASQKRDISAFWRPFLSARAIIILLILLFSLLPLHVVGQNPSDPTGISVGYYKAEYVNDTIPSMIEAGREYPVVITFVNRGMVSWEYNVEKFGLYYEGLQSSISVDPIFSPIDPGVQIPPLGQVTFPLILNPPEKPGEYTLSFSMATKKGNDYTPFPESFTKIITIIPEGGVSSGELGSIIIDSSPSGAEVMMGENLRGITPLTLPDLNPARYEVVLKHPEYESRWIQLDVEPGSVTRVRVDLTTTQKPDVSTEKLEKFTLLGWIIANLPIVIITIAILFLAFQVLMMNTKVVPENHPLRTITRPIMIFSPKIPDGGKHRGTAQKKGSKTGVEGELTSDSSNMGKTKGGDTKSGKSTKKGNQEVSDRKARRSDEDEGRKKETVEKDEELHVDDVDQTPTDLDNPFGFPSALKDRYEPLGISGDDAYARVFKVMKKENGSIRSLKVAHMKGAGSEILRKEASVWGSMRHPNVVRLYNAEYSEDLTFFENEYLDGIRYKNNRHTSLIGLPKPLREKYALLVIRDIANGLKYTHNLGIRHYHLQAGDVLLTPELRAKISGFARGRNEMGFSIPDSDVLVAPVAYIAPEQRDEALYGNPGKRTDLYQMGVIFYELLTGYIPYGREVYLKVHSDGVFEGNEDILILPSEIRGSLHKFDPIVKKLLAHRKRDRYSSVEEFLRDIDVLERESNR